MVDVIKQHDIQLGELLNINQEESQLYRCTDIPKSC